MSFDLCKHGNSATGCATCSEGANDALPPVPDQSRGGERERLSALLYELGTQLGCVACDHIGPHECAEHRYPAYPTRVNLSDVEQAAWLLSRGVRVPSPDVLPDGMPLACPHCGLTGCWWSDTAKVCARCGKPWVRVPEAGTAPSEALQREGERISDQIAARLGVDINNADVDSADPVDWIMALIRASRSLASSEPRRLCMDPECHLMREHEEHS